MGFILRLRSLNGTGRWKDTLCDAFGSFGYTQKAEDFVGFRALFSRLFVLTPRSFLCRARFQRHFIDGIGVLYRCFFVGDALVFTLGLIDYKPPWIGPRSDCKALQYSVIESTLLKILVSSV